MYAGAVACAVAACSGSSEGLSQVDAGASDQGGETTGGGDAAVQTDADVAGEGPPTPDGSARDPGLRKRVFQLKNGTLGAIPLSSDPRTGLEVADQECTQAGQAYGGGQWRAWLSDSTANALDRLTDVGPWYRLDQQTELFESRALIVGGPLAPISDQHNAVDDTRNLFWTGTLLDGTASADNCNDWRGWVALTGTVGRVDTPGEGWVAPNPLVCSTYLALLCFEQ